jgi:hypothetical protein
MHRLISIISFFFASALLVCGGPAQATILTFDDLKDSNGTPLTNFGDINPAYGDNVNALADAIGSYGLGNGFTPNVTVGYFTRSIATGVTSHSNLDFWTGSYGDLLNVAFPVVPNGHYGEVWLIPSSGFSVTLNSFDLAGWPTVDHLNQPIFILDENLNVLVNLSGTIKGAGPSHTSIAPNLTRSSPLVIRFGDNWNVGIDNINFDQCEAATCGGGGGGAPVPEPSTLLLLGSGLAGLALARKKRIPLSR